ALTGKRRTDMPATNEELTFFSPSFRADLDRFALLRRSIRRFEPSPIRHIVAVPAEDLSLFRKRLAGDSEVVLVTQQELVPSYFYPKAWYRVLQRVLPSQAWR